MSAAPSSFTATSLDRRIQMLRTAMGPLIAAALEDPDVVEIMLNPDRTLWVDRLSMGRAPMGVELSEADGERIIRLVAAHVGAEVHRGQPLLTAELPETGERFEGILPPAAPGPAFALRKRAFGVIPLSRYIEDGMMTAAQAGLLVRAVRERQNILIAGGTSTGKTTLLIRRELFMRLHRRHACRQSTSGPALACSPTSSCVLSPPRAAWPWFAPEPCCQSHASNRH